jgi:hypothetical protein
MFNRSALRQEQSLAHRLCREAEAGRPDFSPELHRRLRSAVLDRSAACSLPRRAPAAAGAFRVVLAAAAIAAGVLAVVFAAQNRLIDGEPSRSDASPAVAQVPSSPPRSPGSPSAKGPAAAGAEIEAVGELADQATEKLETIVEWTGATGRLSFLDENARLAYEALNRHVPLDAVASLAFDAPAAP